MHEIKGRMDTTYEWTCHACGQENKRLDTQDCESCGKQLTDEKCRRHYKLIPEPIKVRHRSLI